ncbi:MAG: transglutaminase family protein [Lachnospiraceae bacterium]|nr:transglutaminase family protein [Lachnospiraceae bacterium]
MDHARRFFRILTEPAAVRFVTRLLAALAALEMLEVFFGCSFSMKLPFLLLPAASLLAGELSGRPLLGLFSGAVLTLFVSFLFTRWSGSGEPAAAPENMLLSGGVFLFIAFLTAEGSDSASQERFGLRSHRNAGSSFLTAILLTGLLCGFFFDRSLSAVTTASVLALVLFEILALVNPSAQRYFILLMMFEGVCLSFPRSADPLDWSFAVRAGQRALSRIEYLFEDISYRFSWVPGDDRGAAYNGMGFFAAPNGNADRIQLKISRKNKAPRTYLAGTRYTVPGNRGWTGKENETLPGEDLINLAAALWRSGQSGDAPPAFLTAGNTRIEYWYLHTRDVICPEYTYEVHLSDPSLTENSSGSLRFRRAQGKGTYYDASWIDVDTGSDSFDEMIRLCEPNAQKIPSYEELAGILDMLPGVMASDILSEADYSSWTAKQGGPSSVYLNADGATDRMRELAETITASCIGDYEKCLAVEAFLRQFRYNTEADYSKKENITDAFLFDVQEGWCTHYASAMVLLLRLSGIPARYTEGFLCRYGLREDGFYLVSAGSAHAWPEAWIPGYGWMRFEPTAGYYTRQEVSWTNAETDPDANREGTDEGDASGYSPRISATVPTPAPDESLPEEDTASRGRKTFLRVALTAAAVFPLYLLLILVLFRLIRRIRYRRASLKDRIRLQLSDCFYLIRKSFPGDWANVPLSAYPEALPDGSVKEDLSRLVTEWYRIRYRGDKPDEEIASLAESTVMSLKRDYLSIKGPRKVLRWLDLLLKMRSPVALQRSHPRDNAS